MVLVHPHIRGCGIGTSLLNKTIAYLQNKGVRSIKLDATPMGKQIYDGLGFKELTGFQGGIPEKSIHEFLNLNSIRITENSLEKLCEFDEQYFGVSRVTLLRELLARNDEWALYIEDEHGIVGFIMAHKGYEAVQIGPWISREKDAAESLFQTLLARLPAGTLIYLDMPNLNECGLSLMQKYNVQRQRGFTRKYLGNNDFPGECDCIYGTSGPEVG